jgi:hypothetical protein
MKQEIFINSLSGNTPPESSSAYLRSLWFDAHGDWNKAHEIIQDIDDKEASWVHAYLHRKEGDLENAAYWYALAGKKMPDVSLDLEWRDLVNAFT